MTELVEKSEVTAPIPPMEDPFNGYSEISLKTDTSEKKEEENNLKMVSESATEENKWEGKYEKFIVIKKSDLGSLVRLTDSLMRTAMDDYGKSVMFHCEGSDIVISYSNRPYFMKCRVLNHSNSSVGDFFLSIPLLRKVLSSCGDSLVVVEKEDGGRTIYNFEVLGGLMYLETIQSLSSEVYDFTLPEPKNVIDMQAADICFHSLASVVALSERSSEKTIALKNGNAFFNATFFSAKVKSPFTGGEEFVVYKVVSDMLGVLVDVCSSLSYSVQENTLVVSGDNFTCKCPISLKTDDFYSPAVDTMLNFEANVSFNTSQFVNLIGLVTNLDYLCDIMKCDFTSKEMKVTVYSKSFENKSVYSYPYLEGTTKSGDVSVSANVLKVIYSYINDAARYTLTDDGICISLSDFCRLIVRPLSR